MTKKTLLFLAALIVCVLAIMGPLFLIKTGQFKAMGAAGAAKVYPPTTVSAVPAKRDTWADSMMSPGSLHAVQGVTVAAEAPGKVAKIAFEPGAAVQAGDLLIQLDITTEEAQLRAAEAAAALARASLNRARELRQSGTNSPADLDVADAQAKQALAQAEGIRAVIAKKSIRAPFAGRLGLRFVNLGQILREGDPIATLQTLDPIYVNFSLPQQRLAQLAPGTAVRVTSDAAPGDSFAGAINAISPEIDAATRNIRIQATLANHDEKLRPGMYANVEVMLPSEAAVLVIPATAVLYAPYGDSVFVVVEQKNEKSGKTQKVLRQQFVRLGAARGDFVSVQDGLKDGDMVVSAGGFKLRPGMPVVIDNALALDSQLAPKPKNT
ncbi:MAG: efflux RND transporter periplasmic adaptor subunit [Opitutae bacterium]|nr:efflux RND transporter periplasmic adaptor subunit [Opitutae bacterium]